MKYLLDTNVVSELRKVGTSRCHPAVAAWVEDMEIAETCLSVLTLMELEIGYLRLRRYDYMQAAVFKGWISGYVRPVFSDRLLVFDISVAMRCAELHVPNKRPERDGMIAATALHHDLTVVTRNTRDFQGTGVRLLNPWDG